MDLYKISNYVKPTTLELCGFTEKSIVLLTHQVGRDYVIFLSVPTKLEQQRLVILEEQPGLENWYFQTIPKITQTNPKSTQTNPELTETYQSSAKQSEFTKHFIEAITTKHRIPARKLEKILKDSLIKERSTSKNKTSVLK